jgi:hypothetical protein
MMFDMKTMIQVRTSMPPSLLRGGERLQYVRRFKGGVSSGRAKTLLKEAVHARTSLDRLKKH